jgi:hypothetical protein
MASGTDWLIGTLGQSQTSSSARFYPVPNRAEQLRSGTRHGGSRLAENFRTFGAMARPTSHTVPRTTLHVDDPGYRIHVLSFPDLDKQFLTIHSHWHAATGALTSELIRQSLGFNRRRLSRYNLGKLWVIS